MKIRKTVTAAVLSAMMMSMLCGCNLYHEICDRNVPHELFDQLCAVGVLECEITTEILVDEEHMEFAESCFDDIEIMGAKLALPMNIGDLPEGFAAVLSDEEFMNYNTAGYVYGRMYFDENYICDIDVMIPENSSKSEGIIVGMDFSKNPVHVEPAVYIGGEYIFMSPGKADELLGENNNEVNIYYSLGDGRIINMWKPQSNDMGVYAVHINTMGIIA